VHQTRLNRFFQVDSARDSVETRDEALCARRKILRGWICGSAALALLTLTPLAMAQEDFGDAADPGTTTDRFGTPSVPIGDGTLTLGDLVDAESSPGAYNDQATADDNADTDDEDGVLLPADFSPGQDFEIDVIVSRLIGADSYLSVWVDWNGDGVFGDTDTDEQLLDDFTDGSKTITAADISAAGVPNTGFDGFTYLRARVCDQPGDCNSPKKSTTTSTKGEIEDYRIRIVPFSLGRMACGPEGIVANTDEGDWDEIDLGGGTVLTDAQVDDGSADQLNGIGFNVTDNRVWGYRRGGATPGQLSVSYRVNATEYDTAFTDAIVDLPDEDFFTGDVSATGSGAAKAGLLYLADNSFTTLYIVDVDPSSTNYLGAATSVTLTGDFGVAQLADFAFNPQDGLIYGVRDNNSLVQIDPDTGFVDEIDPDVGQNCATAFGAQFFDSAGTLYFYCNEDGNVFTLDLSTVPGQPAEADFLRTEVSGLAFNDGARCTQAGDAGLDFGDVDRPGIRTKSINNGARHALRDADSLYIGASNRPDADTGSQENLAATADDTDGNDDEATPDYIAEDNPDLTNDGDGVFEFGETFRVELLATNLTTTAALLCGWIDFDGNGQFDNVDSGDNSDGERECAVVDAGVTDESVKLDFKIPDSNFDPDKPDFASRYRITTDWATDGSETGAASFGSATDGEVEDHLIDNQDLPVSISGFRSYETSEGLVIEWGTVSETQNVGFHLWADFGDGMQLLNSAMIPTRISDAVKPANYRYVASGVDAGKITDLAVTAVDVRGKEEIYGLFSPGKRYGTAIAPAELDWATIRQQSDVRVGEHAAGRRALRDFETISAVDLKVSDEGVQTISWQALANAGLDLTGAQLDQIAVTLKGEPVARHIVPSAEGSATFGPGSQIRFWGIRPAGEDELYLDDYLYRVSVDSGKARDVAAGGTRSGLGPESVVLEISEDRDLSYNFVNPLPDPWFAGVLWDTQNQSYSTVFELPQTIRIDEPARIKALVTGYTLLDVTPDHHVRMRVNGQVVGDWMFDGITAQTLEATIPAGLLAPGENTIKLEAPGGTDAHIDVSLVDRIRIDYPTTPHVVDDRLLISDIPEGSGLTLTGLSVDEAELYAWTGESLHVLTAERSTGNRDPEVLFDAGFESSETAIPALRFATLDQQAEYWASTTDRLYQPTVAGSVVDEDLMDGVTADFLVIGHPAFLPLSDDEAHPLNSYLAHRAQDGWDIEVFDITRIQQHYGWGMPLPEALTRFLGVADKSTGFSHVLLVGGDSYDYTDNLGVGSISFIPTKYAATNEIPHTPSDGLLADLDGDGLSDKAIGRWPVRTEADLSAIVEKTIAWDNDPQALQNAIWVADSENPTSTTFDLTFEDQADRMVDAMVSNGWHEQDVGRIYYDQVSPATGQSVSDTARNEMFALQEQGRSLTGFVGHGSPAMWTFQGLLSPDDIGDLYNSGSPTLIGTMTCYTSYFVSPQGDSVAHRWMNGYREDVNGAPIPGVANGAVAIHGAATLSDYLANENFVRVVMDQQFEGATLGEAVQSGRARAAADGETDLVINWTLLGDPTLVIN